MVQLNKQGFGGCLADDMGLGKTLQTLTLLQYIYKPLSPDAVTAPYEARIYRNHSLPTVSRTRNVLPTILPSESR